MIREQKGVRYFTGRKTGEKRKTGVSNIPENSVGGRSATRRGVSSGGDPLIESRASREAEDASAQPCARHDARHSRSRLNSQLERASGTGKKVVKELLCPHSMRFDRLYQSIERRSIHFDRIGRRRESVCSACVCKTNARRRLE